MTFRSICCLTLLCLLSTLVAISPAKAAESTWSDILPTGAEVNQVMEFGELSYLDGPVYMPGGTLIFSNLLANTLYKWDGKKTLKEFLKPARYPTGNTLDRQNRLISCGHNPPVVTRTEKDGTITGLAGFFMGKNLNGPKDVVVRANGDTYFTDNAAPYGTPNVEEKLGFNGVYWISPKKGEILLVKDFKRPNGLAFSPDEKLLYINDSEARHIRVFDVQPDGSLANGKVFAEVKGDNSGWLNGMRVDVQGNVYCTGPGGIHVFTPSGKFLGLIEVATPTNCCWGGVDDKELYITTPTRLYRIRLKIAGVHTGQAEHRVQATRP